MKYIVLVFCFLCTGCVENQQQPQQVFAPQHIYTTFYPLHYFCTRIVGETIPVSCVLPANEDAGLWFIDEAQARSIQDNGLLLYNGAQFEPWPEQLFLHQTARVDCSANITLHRHDAHTTHQHGPAATSQHTHDGHIWLSPRNALQQVHTITAALSKHFPHHANLFSTNAQSLLQDLQHLDTLLKQSTPPRLLCNHPSYNYLASTYGWSIQTIDCDPQQVPPVEVLQAFSQSSATIMLWEHEPSLVVMNAFTTIRPITHLVFDPCEHDTGVDYITRMKTNILRLHASY